MKLLNIVKLSKFIDNNPILDRLYFEFNNGQICGIISDDIEKLKTFINIIGGLESEDEGKVYYNSKELSLRDRQRNVAIVRDNFQVIDKLTILDNIFMSNSVQYSHLGFVNKTMMTKKANDILNRFHVELDLEEKAKNLTPNEKSIIEIARALIADKKYYIFLFTTRHLTLRQYEEFEIIIRELKSKGRCIILIPSTADDIKLFVDKLYLFQDSKFVKVESFDKINNEKLNELLLSSGKMKEIQIFEPIYNAKKLIKNRINEEEIDMKVIADEIFMGYDNFRKRFKNEVGISPHQYFINCKIEKAKELLLNSPLEIQDIAFNLGFKDQYYFSRIFKLKECVSPSAFRMGRKDKFIFNGEE